MGTRSLRRAVTGALLLCFVGLAAGRSVAQELPQCFIGTSPCGTPETLYRQIRRCLQDRSLCREPPTNAAMQGRSDAIPALPAELRPAHGGNPLSVSAARPGLRHQATLQEPVAEPVGPAEPEAKQDAASAAAIDQIARDLPLDEDMRGISDAMPARPAVLALRLGLRRTTVSAIDMRGRSPSSEEIVQALAPRQ
jgi:hypothetical protein